MKLRRLGVLLSVLFPVLFSTGYARPVHDVTESAAFAKEDASLWKQRPRHIWENTPFWRLFSDGAYQQRLFEWLPASRDFRHFGEPRFREQRPWYFEAKTSYEVVGRHLLKESFESNVIVLQVFVTHPAVYDVLDLGLYGGFESYFRVPGHVRSEDIVEKEELQLTAKGVRYPAFFFRLKMERRNKHHFHLCRLAMEIPEKRMVLVAEQDVCVGRRVLHNLLSGIAYHRFFEKFPEVGKVD